MRILFSGVPGFGHLFPLLPLARAARHRNHNVAFMTSAGAAGLVDNEFPVVAAGPMIDDIMAVVRRRLPDADPANPTAELAAELFAAASVDLTVDDALDAADEFRPDLIVGESSDFVAPLVARALRVPFAELALGTLLFR